MEKSKRGRSYASGIPFLPIVALSWGALACTGVVDGTAPGGSSGNSNNNNHGGSANGGSSQGGAPRGVAPAGYKAIHRLNRAEYNATVADVLGTSLQPATGAWRRRINFTLPSRMPTCGFPVVRPSAA